MRCWEARRADALAGTWWPVRYNRPIEPNADYAILLKCPLCENTCALRDALSDLPRMDGTHGHLIAPDGEVSPSVVCPNQNCTWHVFIRLIDYKGE